MNLRRWVGWTGAGAVVLGLLIQLVPYGRAHSNPPVTGEPAWDSAETHSLARRACYDCHSHETRWPWYAHVAPVSWLVQRDVDGGRIALNFSTGGRGDEAHEAAESVQEGEMPPRAYVLLHPEASLSTAESAALVRGLAATLGGGAGEGGRREED